MLFNILFREAQQNSGIWLLVFPDGIYSTGNQPIMQECRAPYIFSVSWYDWL